MKGEARWTWMVEQAGYLTGHYIAVDGGQHRTAF
ncbi:hypothetical protein SAMN05443668_103350 [Cryptosporangium aurantiacum]|uniref:Enoyl-(Acyl carrier protein) reductase n=1 Tax=Cryptosporangium aurantiacum TaxID=134849 RepID=A0A1M7PH23_9ACTN|nr:hypothetical protein SAMN05443668_103350 [Cryptosporangium aurantiacum]